MAIIENGILVKVEKEDIVNLTYVTPPSVRVIGPHAFYECGDLCHLELGSNVIGVGKHLFHEDSPLEVVVATNNLLVIGEGAFEQCGLLKSFLISDSTSKENTPFYCTGSEFIRLFGYYEKSSENYKRVQQLEASLVSNDWYETTDASQCYPLYAGIYRDAFRYYIDGSNNSYCAPSLVFQIPNQMQIIGENNAIFTDRFLLPNQNMSNIIKIICGSGEFVDSKSITRILKYEQAKKLISANVTRIAKEQKSNSESKLSFFKKTEKKDECIYSLEKYITLIEIKLDLLETLSEKTASYFKSHFEEIKAIKNENKRHIELAKFYNALSTVCLLMTTNTLFSRNDSSMQIKDVREKILDIKNKLLYGSLADYIKDTNFMKYLIDEVYNTLYRLIKQELIKEGTMTVYDDMSEDDLMKLLHFFVSDVKTNAPELAPLFLNCETLSARMLTDYFKATSKESLEASSTDTSLSTSLAKNMILRQNNISPPFNIRVVRMENLGSYKLERGLPVPKAFSIKNR